MNQPQVMGLFPEPIARYGLWPQTWRDQLLSLELDPHRVNHSYSRSRRVLDDLPDLKQIIEQQINAYARDILAVREEFWITESWINRYDQGDSIHRHSHPNAFISGTWYWQTPDTEILFHRRGLNADRSWTMEITQYPDDQHPWALQTTAVAVTEGDLILWNSYLQHSVREWPNETPRYTLSFNSLPRSWGAEFSRVGEAAAQIPEREAQQRKIF